MSDQKNDKVDEDIVITDSEIGDLIERVDTLESTVDHITEQHASITHSLKEFSNRIDDMEDEIDETKEAVENLESDSDIKTSKIRGINKSLDSLEEGFTEVKSEMEETTQNIERRINALENTVGVDDKDIAEAMKPDACELEQLTTIPENKRGDEFPVRVQRAIVIYENFDGISTTVANGKRLLSKDIKMFLNGHSENKIRYSQVQRVIDSFIEKTGDRYKDIQTDEGRAIFWKNN